MTTVQEEFVADPIDRSRYAEGQTLDAASLNRDAEQIANGQSLHNRHAHSAGVIAGLLTLTAHPIGDKASSLRKCKLSPGAAIDNAGRLLLVGDDHPGTVAIVDGITDLDVWLKFSQIEIPRVSSRGMPRWKEIPELIVVQAAKDVNSVTDDDGVFLGRFGVPALGSGIGIGAALGIGLVPSPVVGLNPGALGLGVGLGVGLAQAIQFGIQSGRRYVSAVGSRIEAPSGEARILLGPEVPRDTRRFAVGYFDQVKKSFKDALTWETTDAIHLKTQVNISNESISDNELEPKQNEPAVLAVGPQRELEIDANARDSEPLRPNVEFIGVSSNETNMPAGVYLAEGKVDQRPFRELRISIPDPGEKNNPQRYRCSIGTAKQCVHGPDLCLQTGFPRGILSVLADGSVEVHENLRVYTDDKDKKPGLIITLQPPVESNDPKPPATVLTKALAFVPLDQAGVLVKCFVSNGKLDIDANIKNLADATAHSLKLYVTVIKKEEATKTPLRFSLDSKKRITKGENFNIAALFTDSQTPETNLQFPVSGDFGITPLVNLLILGVNDDNAIVQLQIDVTATSPTPT